MPEFEYIESLENDKIVKLGIEEVDSSRDAVVTVKMGETVNLGNCNFKKVSVSLSYPCNRDEVDETFKCVADWVKDKLQSCL